MHLPTLLGIFTALLFQVSAALNNHLTNDASDFHQHKQVSGSFQRPRGDLQPVSYSHALRAKRLYSKNKFVKKFLYNRRDYATTLRYLRAAMSSYRKVLVAPPPAQLEQLEQQLPPVPSDPFTPPPAPPVVEQIPAEDPIPTEEQTPSPTVTEEVAPPPDPETETSPLPDTSSSTDTALEATTTTVMLNNGKIETIPLSVDLEEGDIFDPEEDPDDRDAPPFANGKPVSREE